MMVAWIAPTQTMETWSLYLLGYGDMESISARVWRHGVYICSGMETWSLYLLGYGDVTKDTVVSTRRIRHGYSGRPYRRPASSGHGVRSRGWVASSGPCAAPCPPARCVR